MFRRFAAAAAACAAIVGVGCTALFIAAGADLPRFYSVLAVWTVLPLVWGIWAMLAPPTWVPARLPWWGAILGLLLGVFVLYVLNLPARVLNLTLSPLMRLLPLALITLFYYLLWHLVRIAWGALAEREN